MRENNKSITSKQLLYLADLMDQAGVDPAAHDLNNMTRYQASLLIEQYKQSIDWDKRIKAKMIEIDKRK